MVARKALRAVIELALADERASPPHCLARNEARKTARRKNRAA
jgi:hypothetical protein